jgi:hypothetical protein
MHCTIVRVSAQSDTRHSVYDNNAGIVDVMYAAVAQCSDKRLLCVNCGNSIRRLLASNVCRQTVLRLVCKMRCNTAAFMGDMPECCLASGANKLH